jgi:hypothetical protein
MDKTGGVCHIEAREGNLLRLGVHPVSPTKSGTIFQIVPLSAYNLLRLGVHPILSDADFDD